MPDIRNFDVYSNIGKYFAKFDYMGVNPTLLACKGFLSLCDDLRKHGFKLTRNQIEDEKRAYLTIKDQKYVTQNYIWQNYYG